MSDVPARGLVDSTSKQKVPVRGLEWARMVHAPFLESAQLVTLHGEDLRKRATDSGHQCPEKNRRRLQSGNDQTVFHVDDHSREKAGRENRLTTKDLRKELDLWRCRALSRLDNFQELTSSSSSNNVVEHTDASIEAINGRKYLDPGRSHKKHLPSPEEVNLSTPRNVPTSREYFLSAHNKSYVETSPGYELNGYSVRDSDNQKSVIGLLDESLSSEHILTENDGKNIKTPKSLEELHRRLSDETDILHSLSQPRSRRPISALFSRHTEISRNIGAFEQNVEAVSKNFPGTLPSAHPVANCLSVECSRDSQSRNDRLDVRDASGNLVTAAVTPYLDVSQSKNTIGKANHSARRRNQLQTLGCLASSAHDCISTEHLLSFQKGEHGVHESSSLNNRTKNASINHSGTFNVINSPSKSHSYVNGEFQQESYTVKPLPSRDELNDCSSRQMLARRAAVSLLLSAGIPRLRNDISSVKYEHGPVLSSAKVYNSNLYNEKVMSNGKRQPGSNAASDISHEHSRCRSQQVDHQVSSNRLKATTESNIFTIELSRRGSRQYSDPQIPANPQSGLKHNSWQLHSDLLNAPRIARYNRIGRVEPGSVDSVVQAPGFVQSCYPDEHSDSNSHVYNTNNSLPFSRHNEPQVTRPTTKAVVSVLNGGNNSNLSFIYSGRNQIHHSEAAWESVIKQQNHTNHTRQNQNEARPNVVPVSYGRNISVLGITRDFLQNKNSRNTHRHLKCKSNRYPHFGVEDSKLRGNELAETTVKMERKLGFASRPFMFSTNGASYNGNPTIVCEFENMNTKTNINVKNGEFKQQKVISAVEGSNVKTGKLTNVESQRHIGTYQRCLSEEMECKPFGDSHLLSVHDSLFCNGTTAGLEHKTTRLMDPYFPPIYQSYPSLPLYLSPQLAEHGLSVPRLPLSCPPSPPSYSRQDSGETISAVRHQDYARSFVHLPLPGQSPIPTFQLTPTHEVTGLNLEHIDQEWQRRGSRTSFRSQRSKSSGKTSNLFLGVNMVSAWTKWSKDRRASYRRRQEELAKEQEPRSVTTHCRMSTPVRKARQEGLKFVHPDLESQYLSEEDLNRLRRQTQQQSNTTLRMARSHKKRFWPKTETKLDYHHWHAVQTMFEHRLFFWFRLFGFLVSWAALVLVIFSLSHHSWLRRNSLNVTLEEGFWTNCSHPVNDLEHSPDCRDSQARDWQNVIIGLLIFAATFGLLASILSICGVCTNPLPRKIYYFHSAGEIFLISAVSATIALVVFPIAVELDSSIRAARYGLGYGLGWAAAFFFLAAAVCMSLDDLVRESARAKCCRWCWRGKYGDRHDLRQV